MITESFVNSCLSLLLNKQSKIKRSPALYRDILEIIDFYEGKHSFEIPVAVKGKLSCLKKASRMLLDGRQIDSIYDSLVSGKFKQYSDFLYRVISDEMEDDVFHDYLKQVRIRKKVKSLFENYDELDELLDVVKVTDFGDWVMVKAGNMKLTFAKGDGMIVNTSGGGCPDIPNLHAEMMGKILTDAPLPRDVGFTLCALMLNRALEECLDIWQGGRQL